MTPDPFSTRREFLGATAAAMAAGAVVRGPDDGARSAPLPELPEGLKRAIAAARPSRLSRLPADLPDRLGASHVGGLYHLTDRPFLVEGAERLIALGTRLVKFWFPPRDPAASYPWNARWPDCGDFVELARTDDFRAAFDLPFRTIVLEAIEPYGEPWRSTDPKEPEHLDRVERAFQDLTAHLYRAYQGRDVTFVLQNWEGDWRLRGGYPSEWRPARAEAETLCTRMARWLEARQRGVATARRAHAPGARCRVAHACEVNRVFDGRNGMPTVTHDVLPRVELDLVSYSSYDGLASPERLAQGLLEIRRHARTGPLFGPGAVMIGEIGIPENDQPDRIAERWDGYLGVALALGIPYTLQWELYCNERRKGRPAGPSGQPLRDPEGCRGFWLVRPDGELSVTGRLFEDLWRRAGAPRARPETGKQTVDAANGDGLK